MEAEVASLPELAPGRRLLEVMPWGGTYSAMLRRRFGPEVHLHLAELSPHNHAFIRERLRQDGCAVANLHSELMIVGRLPCADGTIDAAFLPRVLEQVPEPWRLLDEVARVLRPGGLAVVSARNLWSRHGYAYCRVLSRAQVRNPGPFRPRPAVAVRRALRRRFRLTREFGLADAGPAGVRRIDGVGRYFAPLFVTHAIKT
jgi:SAM-dependent methyltransferase